MSTDPFHERLLAIVKSLPETEEAWPWGSIHCKVGGKIFVGWGRHEDGIMSIGFRTHLTLQSMLVASDPRFSIAKYVGQHGGVDMRLGPKPNWDEVRQLIVESYKIMAPKRLAKKLDELDSHAPEKPAKKKPAAKKKAAALPKKNASPKKKRG